MPSRRENSKCPASHLIARVSPNRRSCVQTDTASRSLVTRPLPATVAYGCCLPQGYIFCHIALPAARAGRPAAIDFLCRSLPLAAPLEPLPRARFSSDSSSSSLLWLAPPEKDHLARNPLRRCERNEGNVIHVCQHCSPLALWTIPAPHPTRSAGPGRARRQHVVLLASPVLDKFPAALVLPGRQHARALDQRGRRSAHRPFLRGYFVHAGLDCAPLQGCGALLRFLLGFRLVHHQLRLHPFLRDPDDLEAGLLALRIRERSDRCVVGMHRRGAADRRRRNHPVRPHCPRSRQPTRQRAIPRPHSSIATGRARFRPRYSHPHLELRRGAAIRMGGSRNPRCD